MGKLTDHNTDKLEELVESGGLTQESMDILKRLTGIKKDAAHQHSYIPIELLNESFDSRTRKWYMAEAQSSERTRTSKLYCPDCKETIEL